MLGLLLFPYIAAPWGYQGVVISLAVMSVLSLLLTRWIPDRGKKVAISSVDSGRGAIPMKPLILGLIVVLLWFTGLSGVWAFIERAGIASGLDQASVGGVLAAGMGIGMISALMAAWLGDRFGRYWQSVVSLTVHAFLAILIVASGSTSVYIVSVLLFTFVWNLGLPYLMGLIATADISGRFVVLTIAAQALGNTIGPTIAGSVATSESLLPIGYVASALCLVSLTFYLVFIKMVRGLDFSEIKEIANKSVT